MAKKEHLACLGKGVEAWNAWRKKRDVSPDLLGANLAGADLVGADLSRANLGDANLSQANLTNTDLTEAYLGGANLIATQLCNAVLEKADLDTANLAAANLNGANLTKAWLVSTILRFTDLSGAILKEATLVEAIFADVDLTHTIGLDTCNHWGPSIVDYRTLRKSGPLPLAFLRGVGLSEVLIEYLPSILNRPLQYYSCFISYAAKNQDFADRLHSDLQSKSARCWFAPHDMPIGGKILDEIDTAIRLRDKLLLILSEHSIGSKWVEDEVTKAFEEERKRGQTVLFPIRLDDAVMETDEAWAAKLRARHIGDFRRWKDHDAYKAAFERVLRDLTVRKGNG